MDQILAPLPIGFAVFLVHLATIPITGTGINPARSLGAALVYNKDQAWDNHVSLFYIFFLIFFFEVNNVNQNCIHYFGAVDFLGWAFYWGSTCCSLPSDCDPSYSLQVKEAALKLKRCYENNKNMLTKCH